VILTGGVTEAEAADRLLAERKADLIGVGRAILNDSGWARRAVESMR
ncbi:MAG TPA: NADH:flavin oxidoreductase, partial [Bacillota bacterium]